MDKPSHPIYMGGESGYSLYPPSPSPTYVEKEQVEYARRWMETLCKGDPHLMVPLYRDHAILIPTLSGIKEGHEEILSYFYEFMSREGLCGKYDEVIHQHLPNGWFLLSGLYTFSWLSMDVEVVQARFSFVFDHDGVIVNHHSSAVPGE